MPKTMFASCWHESAHESAALWAQYANTGISIRSTVRRIQSAVTDDRNYYLGRIQYLDFDTEDDERNDLNVLVPPFLKRRSFEHEREVRVLVWDSRYIAQEEPPPSLSLTIDPVHLIEAIYISPESPHWILRPVEDLLSRFGFSEPPLVRSPLYDRHVY